MTQWLLLSGCVSNPSAPNLGDLYSELAQSADPYRNPIIVIPGMLGSRLVDAKNNEIAWGAFGLGQVDPDTDSGARLLALPMARDKKLHELRDQVKPAGALDRVVFNFLGVPVELNAYFNILRTLGVGGYRDEALGESGAIDYGNEHFTCFQFDYDWRRDLVETAKELDRFIQQKARYVKDQTLQRYGVKLENVKFDIVTHSMGGLIARYYLRYGNAGLPADGSPPKITWAGAKKVQNLVMIGPPNGGSVDALISLTQGIRPGLLLPHYPPAVLNTMPAIFELLPRTRHAPVLDPSGRPVADLYDPMLWRENGWGMADPQQQDILRMLLPEISDAEQRREIALDHQRKALSRAKKFSAALDRPAKAPPGLRYLLIAGDAEKTQKTVQFDSSGVLRVVETAPGDGSVLRSSALLDERPSNRLSSRLESPIHWTQVLFIFSDHLGLTEDSGFADNVLYFLLESPRSHVPAEPKKAS